MVALGTVISTFWIIAANSWMQTPDGHQIVDGIAVPLDCLVQRGRGNFVKFGQLKVEHHPLAADDMNPGLDGCRRERCRLLFQGHSCRCLRPT